MTIALVELEEVEKTEFSLNRLQATVLPSNITSKKLLLKNQYEYEGFLKQYEIWEGRGFVDLEIYGKILVE